MNVITGGRALALLHAAISDATVAAWDAKYAYNRPRPDDFDRSLRPAIETPDSPSYPSEHAATAGAASEVLAYLFPDRADFFRAKAVEAGETFLIAGTQYRSDVEAGLNLGRQVAQLAIARAMNDGFKCQVGRHHAHRPGYWTGQNPIAPTLGSWKTWALASGSEFRPGPPPAYDSATLTAEMDELRNFQRTPRTNMLASLLGIWLGRRRTTWPGTSNSARRYWNTGSTATRPVWRGLCAGKHRLYDATVACWDAKYTYWAWRPFQYEQYYPNNPGFQPLFATPNHPSYPSAHSCLSGAAAEFLRISSPRGQPVHRMATEAGEARIWAGIHFRSDIVAGQDLAPQSGGQGDWHRPGRCFRPGSASALARPSHWRAICGHPFRVRRPQIASEVGSPMRGMEGVPMMIHFAAIKGLQQQTWAAGDYSKIAAPMMLMAELLCEAVDLCAGQKVWDVATGSGNTAQPLPAVGAKSSG